MRREWLGLLIIFLLTLPTAANAQCRKRILVFLDVSGTMVTRSPDSPFQQSLGAIQDLLQQQGLIEGDDVLEIVFFGDAATSPRHVEGSDAAATVQTLRSEQPRGDLTTDFRLFLDSLARALQDKTPYNSQVVLLGSDLVHEKVNARPNDEDLQDWAAVLNEKTAALQRIRESAERNRTSFVFFVPDAPVSSKFDRRPVQDKVWDDLSKALPNVRRVSPRSGRSELARELKSALLIPPQLTISRDEENPKQLAFIVGNPNCYPLRLKSLSVQRVLDDGTLSEPVTFGVSAEEATLSGIGAEEATRLLKRPIPSGAEWETVKDLQGSVATEGGPTGFTKGTAGSWLKYRPKQGAVEGNLLFTPVLRLDLELQGHTEEPKTYTLSIRPITQGDDTPALATAKFESPKGLSAQQSIFVRIVLPAARSIRELAVNKVPFRVTIGDGALLLGEKKDTSEILDDQSASHSNLFLLLASLGAVCAVTYAFLRVKNIVGHYPALDLGRRMNVWWWGMATLSILPAAANFFHVNLLRLFSPSAIDWSAEGLSVIVLFATLSFAIRSVQKAEFGQNVLTARPPLSLAQYQRRSQLGVWLPWVVGLLVTAAFALSWFLIRPPVSEKLSRDLNPTQLHVVSD